MLKCLLELTNCDVFPLNSDPANRSFPNPNLLFWFSFVVKTNAFRSSDFSECFFYRKILYWYPRRLHGILNRIQMDHLHSTDFQRPLFPVKNSTSDESFSFYRIQSCILTICDSKMRKFSV